MSTQHKFLQSQDPGDWKEDQTDESLRQNLSAHSSPVLIRQLYPMRARVIGKDLFSSSRAGHIYPYARTLWTPSVFPIQVFAISDDGKTTNKFAYNSKEVELLPADE